MEDPESVRLLSAAVVWEVAIKVGLGRLTIGTDVATWSTQARRDLAADSVAVTEQHAAGVAQLPHHHRDPFDRLLVSQARALQVPLVTADPALAAYDVEVLSIR